MEIACTYWEAGDGLLAGHLNDYPDHLTQGHDLAELEDMLADLYRIRQEEEKRLSQKRSTIYTKTRGQTRPPKSPAIQMSTSYTPLILNCLSNMLDRAVFL